MTDRIGSTPSRKEFLDFYAPDVNALPLPQTAASDTEKNSSVENKITPQETLKKLESGNKTQPKIIESEPKPTQQPNGFCGKGHPGI